MIAVIQNLEVFVLIRSIHAGNLDSVLPFIPLLLHMDAFCIQFGFISIRFDFYAHLLFPMGHVDGFITQHRKSCLGKIAGQSVILFSLI